MFSRIRPFDLQRLRNGLASIPVELIYRIECGKAIYGHGQCMVTSGLLMMFHLINGVQCT